MDISDELEDRVMVWLREARAVLSGAKSRSIVGGLLLGVSVAAIAVAIFACELIVRLHLSGRW